MTVTFLVAVEEDLTDPVSLSLIAEELMDDLISKGHNVQSVHPWARPNNPQAQPAGGFTALPETPSL